MTKLLLPNIVMTLLASLVYIEPSNGHHHTHALYVHMHCMYTVSQLSTLISNHISKNPVEMLKDVPQRFYLSMKEINKKIQHEAQIEKVKPRQN